MHLFDARWLLHLIWISGQHSVLQCLEFEKWFSIAQSSAYKNLVTKSTETYAQCKSTCDQKFNGTIARQQPDLIQNLKSNLVTTIFYWIEDNLTCGLLIAIPNDIIMMYPGSSLCFTPFHCICEQRTRSAANNAEQQTTNKSPSTTALTHTVIQTPTSSLLTKLTTHTERNSGPRENSPPTPTNLTKSPWIHDNFNEYFVNYNYSTISQARAFCKTLNATLVAFLDVTQYLKLSGRIHLAAAEYWVDDAMPVEESTCLKLDTSDGSLKSRDCSELAYSICNRLVFQNNISQLLERPEFVEMIREMTVVKNTTSMAARKLTSAEDKRTVAKVSGTLAICMMAGTFLIIFLSDFSRILGTICNWTVLDACTK